MSDNLEKNAARSQAGSKRASMKMVSRGGDYCISLNFLGSGLALLISWARSARKVFSVTIRRATWTSRSSFTNLAENDIIQEGDEFGGAGAEERRSWIRSAYYRRFYFRGYRRFYGRYGRGYAQFYRRGYARFYRRVYQRFA
jgi:hypothetical protein